MNELDFNAACDVKPAFFGWGDLSTQEDRNANERLWDAFQLVEPINDYLRSNPGDALPPCFSAETLKSSGLIKILEKIGPDYFFSHVYRGAGTVKVVEILKKVTKNMNLEWSPCFKSLHGIITKLFIRGKRVKDLVRSTLLLREEISSVPILENFLSEMGQHDVHYHADVPCEEDTWKVTNMYFWMKQNNGVAGIFVPVEVQIMTPRLFISLKTSTYHSIYEEMRLGSTYFNAHRDQSTVDFIHKMETFLGVAIIPTDNMSGNFRFGPASKTDGFISEKVECNGLSFKLQIHGDEQYPGGRVFPYILDGSLKVGEHSSFWTEPLPYANFTVTIEFTTSHKSDILVGLGTDICYHGAERGESFTVVYGYKYWVRKSIFSTQIFYKEKAATEKISRGTIVFKAVRGRGVAVCVPSEVDELNVPMTTTKPLRVGILSWGGWPDSYIHNISVRPDP